MLPNYGERFDTMQPIDAQRTVDENPPAIT
jgi:hypothetical protein